MHQWQETSAALAAAATFTGPARDTGADTDEGHNTDHFLVRLICDQDCTLHIEHSWDNSTWHPSVNGAAGEAIAPGAVVKTYVRENYALGRYHRVRVVNNAVTAQTTFRVDTAFSRAG